MKNLNSFCLKLTLDNYSRSSFERDCQILSSKESIEHLALNITFTGQNDPFPIVFDERNFLANTFLVTSVRLMVSANCLINIHFWKP